MGVTVGLQGGTGGSNCSSPEGGTERRATVPPSAVTPFRRVMGVAMQLLPERSNPYTPVAPFWLRV